MKTKSLTLILLAAMLLITAKAQETQDRRKLTTVQTRSLPYKGKQDAITVRYLNLPWGETTFGYIENGGNRYYSSRTWPIAHITLAISAKYEGKTLKPGDYVLVVTPKNGEQQMTLSVSSFNANGGTFLTPGNVFTETPKDAVEITKRPIAFAKGAPFHEEMNVELKEADEAVDIKISYGDRLLVEKIAFD